MDSLTLKLRNVTDSYEGFIVAVLTYVRKKESRLKAVEEYLNNNPFLLTDDILEFISEQDDFYEDASYCKKLVKLWDPDFEKFTTKEKRRVDEADEEIKSGEYITEENFWNE